MQGIEKIDSRAPEAAVLGSMMLEPQCIGKVLDILPDDTFFWYPEHQIIYLQIVCKYFVNEQVDGLLIRDALDRTGQLEKIGGLDYLQRVLDSVPSAANAEYYAKAVKTHKKQRDLIIAAEDIQKIVAGPDKPGSQIEQIQQIAFSLESDIIQSNYYTFRESVKRVAAELKEQKEVIKTGFHNIDYIIDGFSPGELIILAGRPSMGKSALALQFALNMAKTGLSIVFFTLEMTHKGLIERALRAEQVDDLSKLDIVLHEGGQTPEKQIAFIKTRKHTHRVDAVFIDYLQLMTSGRKPESRNQEITTISRKLKLATVQEQIPIIALSQLNRQVETRDKHRPRLSDLRESGSIEQDADVVMLLNREDYYRRNKNPNAPQDGNTELIIAKARNKPTGIAQLVFLDEYVKFGDKTNFSESLL